MSVKLNTFSDVQNDIAQYEQSQAQPPAAAAEPVVTDLPVDNPDTPIAVAPDTPAAPPAAAAAPDISSSSFSLGEDEPVVDTPAAAPAPAAAPSFNWKDEIKKLDKKEILKELGVNDFALELNDHLARGGSAVDYLNARAIDYNNVSDDVLLKDSIRKEYPTLTPKQIDTIFNRKYGVPDDAPEEDVEFITAQKQADAYKVRQQKISEQQSFKLPEANAPQKDEAYEQWKQQRDVHAQTVEQLTNFYVNHAATKALNESKKVAISLGDDVPPFNFIIDRPEMLTKAFTDGGQTWQKLTSTPTGEPDVQKQQLIALFTYNPQKFIQDIFKYGQERGVYKQLDEGQNAKRPNAPVTPPDPNAKPTYSIGNFGNRGR